MPKVKAPDTLLCPLTHELFKEPVMAEDGHTYEKSPIEKWVKEKGTSPLTRQKLKANFIVNQDKKSQVLHFFEQHNICTFKQFIKTLEEAIRTGSIHKLQQLNYLEDYLEAKDYQTSKPSIGMRMIYDDLPLHLAAAQAHSVSDSNNNNQSTSSTETAIVEWLLKEGANPKAKDPEKETTPLHWATRVSVAKLLVSHGASVNAKATDGRTPLHHAAHGGHIALVKWLLSEGADPAAQDNEGIKPIGMRDYIHPHREETHKEVYDTVSYLLLIAEANIEPYGSQLHLAIQYHQFDAIKELLREKRTEGEYIGLDSKNQRGQTPLHLAAVYGYGKIVKELLTEKEVDINAQNNDGSTPLHMAALQGHVHVMRLLLEKGANYKITDKSGATPAQDAALHNKHEAVKLLQLYEAPEKILVMQGIIADQQKRINLLETQLKQVLERLTPHNTSPAPSPTFFKKN